MSFLLQLVEEYGLVAVFLNVLIEQVGAPIPAYPTLVVTGAMAVQDRYPVYLLLLVAVVASLIADVLWYFAGRRYGRRVMDILCRVSLSLDSCVRQTEYRFGRWGAPGLLIAKFIPGFASLASVLAGTTGTTLTAFILFDALGTVLWAGSAISIGFLFSAAVGDLIDVLDQIGKAGLLLLALATAAYVASKWWKRLRFLRNLHMARITVTERRAGQRAQ